MNARRSLHVSLWPLTLALLAGCGDDDSSTAAGTGGKAGSGGVSTGGAGGGGAAGSAGAGGTSSGGAAGGAGAPTGGGSAGVGGGSAGVGGASSGGASSGGASSGGASSGGASSGGASSGGASSGGASSGGASSGGTGGSVSAGPSSSRHTARPIGTKYAQQGYWEYLPPVMTPKPPLMVFLHGVGENGSGDATELAKVKAAGPPKLIGKDQWPNSRPFVVLSPQHPGGGCPSAAEVHDFITFAIGAYPIDPKRVYLTGLSCGAIGSWSYVGAHLNEKIAAFVSIAGDGKGAWGKQGCKLGQVPIWAFHGDQDGTVDVSGTKVPMEGLAQCTAPAPVAAKMTIYPGVGHDSWTKTYDLSAGHDIYAWMLGFTHP